MAIQEQGFGEGVNLAQQGLSKQRQAGQNIQNTFNDIKNELDQQELNQKTIDIRTRMKQFFEESGTPEKKDGLAFEKLASEEKKRFLKSASNGVIARRLEAELDNQIGSYKTEIGRINRPAEIEKSQQDTVNIVASNNEQISGLIAQGKTEEAKKLNEENIYHLDTNPDLTEAFREKMKAQSKSIITSGTVSNSVDSFMTLIDDILIKKTSYSNDFINEMEKNAGMEEGKLRDIIDSEVVKPEVYANFLVGLNKTLDKPSREFNKFYNTLNMNVGKDGVLRNIDTNEMIDEEELNIVKNTFKTKLTEYQSKYTQKYAEEIQNAERDKNLMTKKFTSGAVIPQAQYDMLMNKHGKYYSDSQKEALDELMKNQVNFNFDPIAANKNIEETHDTFFGQETAKLQYTMYRKSLQDDEVGTLMQNPENNYNHINFKDYGEMLTGMISRTKQVAVTSEKLLTSGAILSDGEKEQFTSLFSGLDMQNRADFIKNFNEQAGSKSLIKLAGQVFEKEGMADFIMTANIMSQEGGSLAAYKTTDAIFSGKEILKNNPDIIKKDLSNKINLLFSDKVENIFLGKASSQVAYIRDSVNAHIAFTLAEKGITIGTEDTTSNIDIDGIVTKSIEAVAGGIATLEGHTKYRTLTPNRSINGVQMEQRIDRLSVNEAEQYNKPAIGSAVVIKGLQEGTYDLQVVNRSGVNDNGYLLVDRADNALAAEDGSDYVLFLSDIGEKTEGIFSSDSEIGKKLLEGKETNITSQKETQEAIKIKSYGAYKDSLEAKRELTLREAKKARNAGAMKTYGEKEDEAKFLEEEIKILKQKERQLIINRSLSNLNF